MSKREGKLVPSSGALVRELSKLSIYCLFVLRHLLVSTFFLSSFSFENMHMAWLQATCLFSSRQPSLDHCYIPTSLWDDFRTARQTANGRLNDFLFPPGTNAANGRWHFLNRHTVTSINVSQIDGSRAELLSESLTTTSDCMTRHSFMTDTKYVYLNNGRSLSWLHQSVQTVSIIEIMIELNMSVMDVCCCMCVW